jgi:hypothetical protein
MNSQRLRRVYHPYWLWEEVAHGMWSDAKDKTEMLGLAIAFTGNSELYGSFMQNVIREWPYSCENALTDHSLNKKAWIGHAACAYALRCPEHITREAWGHLTDEQRILANQEADRAIRDWLHNYSGSR